MDNSDYIMRAESSGNRNAKAQTSSALGPGQFIEGTWLDLIKRYRPDLAQGKSRAEVLAMRTDPELSKEMTRRYEAENEAGLRRAGLPVTPGTVYLTHFAGPGGGIKLLKADPNTPVESILDAKAIAANRFLKGKTAGDVIAWADRKMATARPIKSSAETAPLPNPPIKYLDQTVAAQQLLDGRAFSAPPNASGADARSLVQVPNPANNTSGGGLPTLPSNAAPSVAPASFDDRFGNWPSSPPASAPVRSTTASRGRQPSSDQGNTDFGIYRYPTENQLGFDPGALSAAPQEMASPDARFLVRAPSPQTTAPASPDQPGSLQQPPGSGAGSTRPDLALPPPIWGFPNQSNYDKGDGDNWLLQLLGSIGVR